MIKKIKYALKRKIERNPFFNWILFKNIHRLEFLFPHEQDYFGLRNLFPANYNGDFLDVGGNYGQSTVSFRKLGFVENKIFIFEPNKKLYLKLLRVKKKYKKTYVYNFGLSKKNETRILYTPIRKNKAYLALSSFNKKSLQNQINLQFPEYKNEFKKIKQKCKLRKFDDLKFKIKPKLIKIDVEGDEENVISGLKKTIIKEKPVLLIEYNKNNFSKIYKSLKKFYEVYCYLLNNKKLSKIKKNDLIKLSYGKITKNVYSKKENARCLYFLPKGFKIIN